MYSLCCVAESTTMLLMLLLVSSKTELFYTFANPQYLCVLFVSFY